MESKLLVFIAIDIVASILIIATLIRHVYCERCLCCDSKDT